MTGPHWLQSMTDAGRRSASIFLRDVGHGLLEVSHNMLALLGLLVIAAALFAFGRADLRDRMERQALGWLEQRHGVHPDDAALTGLPDDAETANLVHAMATDPASLSHQQAAVASWLARRYRVAPEPVARLVQESWNVGKRAGLEPTLILAIMAIESSFNPFAQSPVGAQGLMQVMTRIHNDKYAAFGGNLAAFDPVSNLHVGVLVLKECISRAGSLEAGLRYYVGAANLEDDGGYASKVLAEQRHLIQVAAGQNVPVSVANVVAAATPTASAPLRSIAASEPMPPPSATPGVLTPPPQREQVALAP